MVSEGAIAPASRVLIIWPTITFGLAFISVFLRFWSRILARQVGADDYTIAIGLMLTFCVWLIAILSTVYGFEGYHYVELTLPQFKHNLKFTYISNIFYTLALPTIKFSVLLMYRRVFVTKRFYRCTEVVGGIVLLWLIGVIFVDIFTCIPVGSFWNIEQRKRCVNDTKFYYGVAISNILTDVIVLCLPMPMIWRLHLTTRRKVQLSALFLLGGFVVVTSILRCFYLSKVGMADYTYSEIAPAAWTIVEPCVAVVCACLPTLPRLMQDLHAKARSLTGGSLSRILRPSSTGKSGKSSLFGLRSILRGSSKQSDHAPGYAELGEAGPGKRTGYGKASSAYANGEAKDSMADLKSNAGPGESYDLEPVKIRQDISVYKEGV